MLQKYKKSRRIILCNLIFRPKDLPYLCNTLFLFYREFESIHVFLLNISAIHCSCFTLFSIHSTLMINVKPTLSVSSGPMTGP